MFINTKIYLFSVSEKSLRIYTVFLKKFLLLLNLKCSLFFLPKKKKYITLLKSPHVFKKAKEHFELIKYKVVVSIFSNLNFIQLKYLLLNKPKAIKLKITTTGR